MSCTDYERHERLLDCTHQVDPMVAVRLADDCSAQICQDCDAALGVKRWPDVTERIAGPGKGLEVLAMLRALAATRRRAR